MNSSLVLGVLIILIFVTVYKGFRTQGPEGSEGVLGPQGLAGLQGKTVDYFGPTGSRGLLGPQGPSGPFGPLGPLGSSITWSSLNVNYEDNFKGYVPGATFTEVSGPEYSYDVSLNLAKPWPMNTISATCTSSNNSLSSVSVTTVEKNTIFSFDIVRGLKGPQGLGGPSGLQGQPAVGQTGPPGSKGPTGSIGPTALGLETANEGTGLVTKNAIVTYGRTLTGNSTLCLNDSISRTVNSSITYPGNLNIDGLATLGNFLVPESLPIVAANFVSSDNGATITTNSDPAIAELFACQTYVGQFIGNADGSQAEIFTFIDSTKYSALFTLSVQSIYSLPPYNRQLKGYNYLGNVFINDDFTRLDLNERCSSPGFVGSGSTIFINDYTPNLPYLWSLKTTPLFNKFGVF